MIRYYVYYDCEKKHWTWQAIDDNNNVVADGTMWWDTSQEVVAYVKRLMTKFFHAKIEVAEKPYCKPLFRLDQLDDETE